MCSSPFPRLVVSAVCRLSPHMVAPTTHKHASLQNLDNNQEVKIESGSPLSLACVRSGESAGWPMEAAASFLMDPSLLPTLTCQHRHAAVVSVQAGHLQVRWSYAAVGWSTCTAHAHTFHRIDPRGIRAPYPVSCPPSPIQFVRDAVERETGTYMHHQGPSEQKHHSEEGPPAMTQ